MPLRREEIEKLIEEATCVVFLDDVRVATAWLYDYQHLFTAGHIIDGSFEKQVRDIFLSFYPKEGRGDLFGDYPDLKKDLEKCRDGD
ncbi:MAG: hypothetical protein ACJAW3_001370, partial [Lentimonas sp.]